MDSSKNGLKKSSTYLEKNKTAQAHTHTTTERTANKKEVGVMTMLRAFHQSRHNTC